MVQGYIIKSVHGTYLSHGLWWHEHDNIREAYVHPANTIGNLRGQCARWDTKPAYLIPAIWTEESGTVVTGKPKEF